MGSAAERPGGAPLREILETRQGPPLVLTQDDFSVSLRTVVHTLKCGHTTEPYVRDGCRVPPLPKRRRCKECRKNDEGEAVGR